VDFGIYKPVNPRRHNEAVRGLKNPHKHTAINANWIKHAVEVTQTQKHSHWGHGFLKWQAFGGKLSKIQSSQIYLAVTFLEKSENIKTVPRESGLSSDIGARILSCLTLQRAPKDCRKQHIPHHAGKCYALQTHYSQTQPTNGQEHPPITVTQHHPHGSGSAPWERLLDTKLLPHVSVLEQKRRPG